MGFTTSAFIRCNTPEIRARLEEFGYKHYLTNRNGSYLLVDSGDYMIVGRNRILSPPAIDCGTNEELFLALAALNNENDYMQWFTRGKHWLLHTIKSDWRNHHYSLAYHKATCEELIEHFK